MKSMFAIGFMIGFISGMIVLYSFLFMVVSGG